MYRLYTRLSDLWGEVWSSLGCPVQEGATLENEAHPPVMSKRSPGKKQRVAVCKHAGHLLIAKCDHGALKVHEKETEAVDLCWLLQVSTVLTFPPAARGVPWGSVPA